MYLLPLEPVLCAADEYGKNLPTPPESPIEWRPVATRTLLAGITYGVLVRLGLPAQFALAGSAVIMFGPNVVSFLGRTYGPFFKGTPKMRELHLLESSKDRLSNSSFAKQLFYISPVIAAGEEYTLLSWSNFRKPFCSWDRSLRVLWSNELVAVRPIWEFLGKILAVASEGKTRKR